MMDAAPPNAALEHLRGCRDSFHTVIPMIMEDFQERMVPPHISRPLEASMQHQLHLMSQEHPRICFLGKTGSGKTSLMNAIIGKDLLPAEDTGVAVTSAVTEIYHTPELDLEAVVVTASSCSADEWAEKKRFLVEVLAGGMADETGGSAEEEMQGIARKVLAAACPSLPVEEVRVDTVECPEFTQRLDAPGQSVIFHATADAKAWLKDRVHLAEAEEILNSVLTTKVTIAGNFARIPANVKLVDLPGLEDSNLLRSSVAERYFALFCNHAWFCLPKADGRILSNRGLARQVRTLARGGNLKNALVVRTRADDAKRKNAAALDREYEQFRKLCLDELRLLSARSGAGSSADGARGSDGEPPQSRRRLNPEDPPPSSEAVSFAGYVQAIAAPECDGEPAEIEISGVLRRLKTVAADYQQKAEVVVRNVYTELQNMMTQEAHLEEEARAALEAAQREADRVVEEAQLTQEREEAEEAEAARREQELQVAREAEVLRQQRAESLRSVRATIAQVSASIDTFGASLRRSALTPPISNALMRDLRQANHPSILRAVITKGGCHTGSRGTIDMPETFSGAVEVSGQDLPAAFNGFVDRMGNELHTALPADLRQLVEMHLQTARGSINAVLARGGPVYSMLARSLHWPGGTGSVQRALKHAEQAFANRGTGVQKALDEIAGMLCSAPADLVSILNQQMDMRLLDAADEEPRPHEHAQVAQQPLPHTEQTLCVICEEAVAVVRASRVACICNPRPPYSCMACVERIDLQYRRCPMCRGGSA
mmetsp:Transcript_23900/g.43854  ORF Transcript_23900/g.43854 Transcript_23900/m.43854 type:complete len:772 (-) Transcript_23900:141-2456(-)